jgi:hypothetical protein
MSRQPALMVVCLVVMWCGNVLSHLQPREAPIIREIVPDIDKTLAWEFAARGIQSVLAFGMKNSCTERIEALVSSGISVACVTNSKEFRTWRQGQGNRKDVNPVGVGVVIFSQDFQYVPLLTTVSHSMYVKVVAVYGWTNEQGSYVALSAPDATFRKVIFASEARFREAFSMVYSKQIWGTAGGGSGAGSDVAYTTHIRNALINLLSKYRITSMLDSSCGSMAWMPLVLTNISSSQPAFKFMGTDVVDGLIKEHTSKFANNSNWQFKCVDYAHEPLPSGYELVFSRDSLQHLPLDGAWMLLNNVRNSGARYLLVGSYMDSEAPNINIKVGHVIRCLCGSR